MSVPIAKGIKLANGQIAKYDYSELVNVVTDTTLQSAGVAADGKAVGDAIDDVNDTLNKIPPVTVRI